MSATLPKILNYNNLVFDKLEYFQPHKTNQNMQVSTVSYRLKPNQTLPIYIETPKLKTVSGIIKLENRYYIDLELATDNFYDFLTNLDEKNVMSCHFHSHEWFNQRIPLDVIEDYYKSPIRLQRGGKLPIMRIKIPSHNGKILAEFYNNKRDSIDMSKIEVGDEVVCIIEFVGLRFLSQQFIAEWSLSKLKLMRTIPEQTLIPSGYYFSDVVEPLSVEEPSVPEEISNELLEEESVSTPVAKRESSKVEEQPLKADNIIEIDKPVETINAVINEIQEQKKEPKQELEPEPEQEFDFNEYVDEDIIFEDSEYELDDISDDIEEVTFKDSSNVIDNEVNNEVNNEVECDPIVLEKQKMREEALQKMKEYEELMIKQKEYYESLNLTS